MKSFKVQHMLAMGRFFFLEELNARTLALNEIEIVQRNCTVL